MTVAFPTGITKSKVWSINSILTIIKNTSVEAQERMEAWKQDTLEGKGHQ